MSASAIQPISFSFHETHDVRIQVIDGEPWFCLKDVCEILDIKNVSQLASQLDEKGICKIYTPTRGGNQQLVYVNEPNLYRVIFRSNKPEAKQFQDWVFNDVLPTIRKTGSYSTQPTTEPFTSTDVQNLKHILFHMTTNVHMKGAWNQGIWYSLRAVTGRPSPQPFTVSDLPALVNECRRIFKITTAVNNACYEFERAVIRRVVRRHEALEPLLAQMRVQMNEAHGLLPLERFHEKKLRELQGRIA